MPGTGLPDVDSFARYGGPLVNSGPIDPWTESAEQRNLYAANVAAMTHTIARAFRSFLGGYTAGQTLISDPPTGMSHDAVWPSPPNAKPAVTGVTGGYGFDVFFPTMITDDFNNKRLLKIRRAFASVESTDGTMYIATASVVGTRKVRVYTFSGGAGMGAPASISGQVVTVWIY